MHDNDMDYVSGIAEYWRVPSVWIAKYFYTRLTEVDGYICSFLASQA